MQMVRRAAVAFAPPTSAIAGHPRHGNSMPDADEASPQPGKPNERRRPAQAAAAI